MSNDCYPGLQVLCCVLIIMAIYMYMYTCILHARLRIEVVTFFCPTLLGSCIYCIRRNFGCIEIFVGPLNHKN